VGSFGADVIAPPPTTFPEFRIVFGGGASATDTFGGGVTLRMATGGTDVAEATSGVWPEEMARLVTLAAGDIDAAKAGIGSVGELTSFMPEASDSMPVAATAAAMAAFRFDFRFPWSWSTRTFGLGLVLGGDAPDLSVFPVGFVGVAWSSSESVDESDSVNSSPSAAATDLAFRAEFSYEAVALSA